MATGPSDPLRERAMTTPQDRPAGTSGDYGYDLVHEDVDAGSSPRSGEVRGRAPDRTTGDGPTAGGDYGYDEAHDF